VPDLIAGSQKDLVVVLLFLYSLDIIIYYYFVMPVIAQRLADGTRGVSLPEGTDYGEDFDDNYSSSSPLSKTTSIKDSDEDPLTNSHSSSDADDGSVAITTTVTAKATTSKRERLWKEIRGLQDHNQGGYDDSFNRDALQEYGHDNEENNSNSNSNNNREVQRRRSTRKRLAATHDAPKVRWIHPEDEVIDYDTKELKRFKDLVN